jgi:uncharacterized phage protein (TIGR01671 family)
MRTILFRGKRVSDGTWSEGLLLTNKLGAYIVTEENPHECTEHGYIEIDEYCKVHSDTIGQYVGRDDPNGVKIFEGDVMKCGTVVEFNTTGIGSCGCCYDAFYGTGFIVSSDDSLYYFDKRNHVIGNIHDNPELVEDEL